MLTVLVSAVIAGYLGFFAAGLLSSIKLRELRRAYLHLAEAVDDFTIHFTVGRDEFPGIARQHVSRLEQALRESDNDYRSVA
jgi:hypothetical protein